MFSLVQSESGKPALLPRRRLLGGLGSPDLAIYFASGHKHASKSPRVRGKELCASFCLKLGTEFRKFPVSWNGHAEQSQPHRTYFMDPQELLLHNTQEQTPASLLTIALKFSLYFGHPSTQSWLSLSIKESQSFWHPLCNGRSREWGIIPLRPVRKASLVLTPPPNSLFFWKMGMTFVGKLPWPKFLRRISALLASIKWC